MGVAVPPEAELARLKDELQSAIQEIAPDLADRRQGAIRLLALDRDRGGLAAEVWSAEDMDDDEAENGLDAFGPHPGLSFVAGGGALEALDLSGTSGFDEAD